MTEDEFLEKLDWLIKNKKDDLIGFFKQEQRISYKGKVIKYLLTKIFLKQILKKLVIKLILLKKISKINI